MKRRTIARITVEKGKRANKRVRQRRARARDPKDLRGAKGALVKTVADAGLQDELAEAEGTPQRHPPIRIRNDW